MSPLILKLTGKKASVCQKCKSDTFWVNRLGGVCCSVCRPNPGEPQAVGELRIENGVWIDGSAERFDLIDSPTSISVNDLSNPIRTGGPTAATTLPTTGGARNKNGSASPVMASAESSRGTGSPEMIVGYSSRGVNGELSEFEIDLFTSEKVWAANSDQWIVLKPKVRFVNRLGGQRLKNRGVRI
jgi:hypothetical protein